LRLLVAQAAVEALDEAGSSVMLSRLYKVQAWATEASSLILFTTVAAAPLPYGSADPTSISFWCIALGLGLILAPVRGLSGGQLALVGLAFVVVAAYALVLHEQLAAHPWFASPHPIWREAAEVLGTPLQPSVSIARNEPFYALGSPLVCMLSLMCGFLVGMDGNRARQLLRVIAWSGAAYAAYGIVAEVFDPTHVLWREKQAYVSVLTATFINRNTAAVYFGSCSIVWATLLAERVRAHAPQGALDWRKLSNRLLSDTPRDMVLSFSMLFICLAAMFMTGSRAGVVLSLLALVAAITVYFRHDLPSRSGVIVAVAAGGVIALVLLQIMGAGVSGRFDIQGLVDTGRLSTYRSTLHMIAAHPWFGTGQGTFVWAYPAYRSADMPLWGVWDRAHSTPLEIAVELGLPLAGLVIVGWTIVLSVLIRGVRVRRRNVVAPLAALGVAMITLLHSLIDFSPQIPGYAIVVFAVIGCGLAQSYSSRRETHHR
jgi:O-Antigen ligase